MEHMETALTTLILAARAERDALMDEWLGESDIDKSRQVDRQLCKAEARLEALRTALQLVWEAQYRELSR